MGLKLKTSSTVIVLANSVEEPCEEAAICVLLIKADFFFWRICRRCTPTKYCRNLKYLLYLFLCHWCKKLVFPPFLLMEKAVLLQEADIRIP